MIKLILILICIKFGHSYPDGAPKSACSTMMPHHNVIAKQCQPKYTIQSETSEYDINQSIRITVRGSTNADSFKGILLVAKDENNQHTIGSWSTLNSSITTLSCNEAENTAITHSSPEEKLEIDALWHAPSFIMEKETIIKATIVTTYNEIYVDCFNITLMPKQKNSSPVVSITKDKTARISSNINANITWNSTNDTVTVTMTAEEVGVGEWRAIGFSLDREMGNEYIFICQVSSTGNASLRRMHTKPGKRPPSPSTADIDIISTVYEDGALACKFSFNTTSEQINDEPAPIDMEENYFLTFAAGILRTEQQVAKHNFTFVSSTTYQLKNSETIYLNGLITTTVDPVSSGPSSTNSLSTTTTISRTNDIRVNISWAYADGVTTVKMKINNLKLSQWLAIGLSLDDSMGEDHVFICQHLDDNTILLERFINPKGHSRSVLASTIANPGGSFNVTLQKFEDGIAYCDFTLSNFVSQRRHVRQTSIPELSQTTNYQPLIAIGNLDTANNLIRHAQNSRMPLAQTVVLNRKEIITYNIQAIGSDSTALIKAHGIIMVFTWIVLVSTGILVARYFKTSWPNDKICGKAVWFGIHRTIMTCVVILTLIAFILILVYKKGQWISKTTQPEFSHSIVGILVISFSIIQPFMALFRCNPDAQNRFIFNYAHAGVGISAFILSIVAIFLALFSTQFEFRLNKTWAILVLWSIWIPIIFVIFELIEIYFRKNVAAIKKTDSYYMNDFRENSSAKTEISQSTENPKKDRLKRLALLFHIVLAFGLALALIIIIGKST